MAKLTSLPFSSLALSPALLFVALPSHLVGSVSKTIEFPDDELVEPLEGLDIAEDGIDLPPPPAPEPEEELELIKPNLLVSDADVVPRAPRGWWGWCREGTEWADVCGGGPS